MIPKIRRLVEKGDTVMYSEDYNKVIDNLYKDISKLYKDADKTRINLKENLDAMIVENIYLRNKLNKIQKTVDILEKEISDDIDYHAYNIRYFDMSNKRHDIPGYMSELDESEKASVITDYGVCSIPFSSKSRLTLLDTQDNVFIPESLEVKVYEDIVENPEETEENMLDTNRSYRAFDGDTTSYWTNIVQYPSSVSEVYITIDIKLPVEEISSNTVNSINLKPFPEETLELLDVQYKVDGGAFRSIETLPDKGVKDLSNTKVVFPEKEINDIRIKVKQSNYLEYMGSHDKKNRIFAFGFRGIDALYNDYQSDESFIVDEIDLSNIGQYFDIIEKPSPITEEGSYSDINHAVNYKLYYFDPDADAYFLHEFDRVLPIDNCNKILVETKLELLYNDISPTLRGSALRFNTK